MLLNTRSTVSQVLFALQLIFSLFIARAQGTNPPSCNPATQFFPQLVEHGEGPDSYGNKTFMQRYQLNNEHYRPGGPLLLYISPQSETFLCVESSNMPEWAKEIGAAIASLEHRGFGLSLPNNSSDLPERYKSITLDNILSDYVYFANYVKKSTPDMLNAPVITFGGSYPGHLSALMRLNYPDEIFGAIAWAAPTNSFGTPESNPEEQYDFMTFASNVYRDQSAEAAAKIENAHRLLGEKMRSKSYDEIAQTFNLCEIPKNDSEIQSFYTNVVVFSYFTASEFSYGIDIMPNLPPNSMDILVNQTLELDDPMEILNASVQLYFPPELFPCVPLAGDEGSTVGVSATLFLYIGCEVYPLETSAIPEGTIFLPSPGAMNFRTEWCKTNFNLTVPDGNEHKKRYKFTDRHIAKSKRVLFMSGELDPVSGTTPLQLLGRVTEDRNASRMIFVHRGAHTEESFPFLPGTKPSVAYAQNIQVQVLKDWLGIL